MNPRNGVRRVALLMATVSLVSACVPRRGTPERSTAQVERQWTTTLDAALAASGEGRYGDADKTIAEFQAANVGTPLAAEAIYWRALLALHPANRHGSPREAAELLDRYLGTRSPARRREAQALKRIATQLRAAASDTTDEARLRAELAKAQEELELIRKRLAQPRP